MTCVVWGGYTLNQDISAPSPQPLIKILPVSFMEIQKDFTDGAESEDFQVIENPVLAPAYERNPFDKNAVPSDGITVTIEKSILTETRYKTKKLLIKTDKGDIWAPWREVNSKLKVWWGETTANWVGRRMLVNVENILVNGEKKKTVVFERA